MKNLHECGCTCHFDPSKFVIKHEICCVSCAKYHIKLWNDSKEKEEKEFLVLKEMNENLGRIYLGFQGMNKEIEEIKERIIFLENNKNKEY